MPNDFSVFDGQETVTYEALGGTSFEAVPALRRPLTQSRQRNVERFVELQADDVVFHLDASVLDAIAPAVGDSVVDANDNTYEIIFVELQSLGKTMAAIGRLTA